MESKYKKEILRQGEPVICSRIRLLSGEEYFAAHMHEPVELVYVMGGSINYKCDTMDFAANVGETAVFNHRQICACSGGENGAEIYSFSFGLTPFVGREYRHLLSLMSGKMRFENHINNTEIGKMLNAVVRECSNPDDVSDIMLSGQMEVLLAYLIRHHIYNPAEAPVINNRFERVLHYVNEHYTEDINTKNMSELISYEESYFCRKFCRLTGMSFTNYVRMLRMEKAKKALLSGASDITEVALSCGYTGLNYFTRCFKMYYGITPSQMLMAAKSGNSGKTE